METSHTPSAGPALKALFLGSPQWTLAVAESLTCGHVQTLAAAESGASEFFLGGITAYTLEQKVRHLGVDRHEAERTRCVSARVAEEMARGVCRLFGSTVGVATTGWAEPSPSAGVTVPLAWWALAFCEEGREPTVQTGRTEVPGLPRVGVQRKVAEVAIGELHRFLQDIRGRA